jgi:NADH dehydrogenase FAD-containing subunit
MQKHLVLVGGGHAHLMTLESIGQFIKKGFKVTVIGPSSHHYYSGMGPGMLGGTYDIDDIRFATKAVVQKQGGNFIQDKVVRIDPEKRMVFTKTGDPFFYDVLSFNAGSYVPIPKTVKKIDNVYAVKPIERLMEASTKLKILFSQKKIIVVIIGGGPSSAEVAGNVWQLAKKINRYLPEIHVFAGRKFMARFSENVRDRVFSSLSKRGIQIHETGYVTETKPDKVYLESGETFPADFIFMALGIKPSTIFEESGLPLGPDKGLLVNKYLQSVKHPEIFGGGDCIYFQPQPLDKVGVYAVRENPVLLNNLMASLENKDLQVFEPGAEYLLIFNIGGEFGVLKKKGLVFGGKIAFMIKDYIDRKFIKKFQAIEKTL